MVSIGALWLPIIVASVLVFIGGFITNMILPHHRSDFSKMPDEDAMANLARSQDLGPGQYMFPHAATPEQMKDPAYVEKVSAGPVGILNIAPADLKAGPTGKQLGAHFLYIVIITLIVAYVTGASVGPGMEYLKVFQVAGTTAWLAYAAAVPLMSIWYFYSWSWTIKEILDGLLYALLTAGTFGWLWPEM